MHETFRRFAHRTSEVVGSSWAFLLAVVVIFIWAVTGPLFAFSDTWQLVINTGTTIVTFLMVFLIQNTQNRDAKAIHLKLDELLRSARGARNQLMDLENCTDEELKEIEAQFVRLRQQALAGPGREQRSRADRQATAAYPDSRSARERESRGDSRTARSGRSAGTHRAP